ncbi:MAG TPA: GtrA family protein [Streptosporangiaceae bacterium]|nr:GtrA family protein [Streptosporangiaceae bacterium]
MRLARRLYERFKMLIHEAAKFGVVGVVGLFITNIVYALLRSNTSAGVVTATTVATIIAALVTYIGNRYWSFRHRERTNVAREGLVFLVLNGIGLLIQDGVVAFSAYALGREHDRLAQFLALNCGIALGTLFRFWSYRRFVWRLQGGTGPGAGSEAPQPAAGPAPAATPAQWSGPAHRAPRHSAPRDGARSNRARDGGAGNNGVSNDRINGRPLHEPAMHDLDPERSREPGVAGPGAPWSGR